MVTKDNKDNHKERICLKCSKLFMSDGPGNRLCRNCQTDNLKYSKSQGNDLITPMPIYSFPGLKDGDHWCICLDRWKQALLDGLAPKVILESTNIVVLESVPLEKLKEYQFNKK